MKHALVIASLLAALTAPAFAEDAAKQSAQVDTGTTASTAAKADVQTVMSSIEATNSNATAIQALTAVHRIDIVNVSDLAGAENLPALEKAVADNQADITGLQAAIMANSALKAKIDQESIDTSDVVAASIAPDGAVTIFVK